ncbi:pyruvate dehydrogenase (acetyl-transferring), homodimeric type [Shewanella xiamenensis]|uniref:pyruvate dehydrogenase (acetyl-transferring), homodimeric type n=1 Tax=Shewanella xiamenensis TaxID=332186 RepID=UPI001F056B71|nr:pyruvate dehydrogenase (acetyl-transferring), homodimeric type [Shewanella xiamenensis]UML93444.1 pyruvate dehydrogenase E1 component [Shewanella xiamenensis]
MSEDMLQDLDPLETQEWVDALQAVLEQEGPERAHFLLEKLIDKARRNGTHLPYTATTAYLNTIPAGQEPHMPGNQEMERRIRAIIRWNALAMVLRGSKKDLELGGHISSFASSATIYDVCFNHFFRAPNEKDGGDLVYFQGHIAPGIYARSFLEGRLTEDQLANFRQEVDGKGLSSYPHPKLMPDYWQFPTVSMGLGPIQAIYQARFLKYLTDRGLKDCSEQTVYCFLGDGECDEPEALGAIGLAAREELDNLVFIINCNLQRLDGPVRGNGKIIQELEGEFRGAGWEVVKVIWGRYWDPLLARDTSGKLLQLMEETVDGEYQNCKAKGGAYTREHFFGKYPETAEMVANMSDDDIWRLNRGGHDPVKVYAALDHARKTKGRPTVILAKTVKGYGLGDAGEGKNIAHNVKKMGIESIRYFRDRMEGLFRQIGIYSPHGQQYTPQDRDIVSYYKEDKQGQVLQDGINELGAMSSWLAAATSYSTNDCPMIPFYIYYSMFGFQRVGDMAWAAGDQQARGFLLGATSGRTTLNGEGLQHEDGHSHILANTIPNCISYDPSYAYEVAVIVQDGLRRMYGEKPENVFYYITTLNENYAMPAMPEGAEEGIRKGIYKLETVAGTKGKVQLLGCGSILGHVRTAAQILASEYGVGSDVFSVTSFNELARDGQDVDRWNMLHPTAEARVPYIATVLGSEATIAATDYMKSFADQVRAFVPTEHYRVLGTDGYGRSDSRANLRRHFEVNEFYVVVAALTELAKRGEIDKQVVADAIAKYGIDADKVNPLYA